MKKFIIKISLGFIVNVIGIYSCSVVLNDFNYNGWQGLLIIALIFNIIFIIARPLLKLLALPFFAISPILFVVFYSFILYGISTLPQKWLNPIDIKTALLAGLAMMIINVLASIFK